MASDREHVGIRGIYVYFPRLMIKQADLEQVDNCSGKYTVGLGQESMTFCGDREDVVSMAATAVMRLLQATGTSYKDIGKLEVGTETGVDRSKSVMSYLVQHFQEHGNNTLQGCDHQHGCYGGTSALFAVSDWVSSPSWDGRLGLAVATDIAVYPEGSPARPTGGGGAAAMLIGPNAPLVIEPYPWRSNFSSHTFDFYKPHGHPLYPMVDGPATTLWFTKAADACAAQLFRQLQQQQQRQGSVVAQPQQQQQHHPPTQKTQQLSLQEQPQQQQQRRMKSEGDLQQVESHRQQSCAGLLQYVDYFLSHAPYNKIVRKIFARVVLHDMLRAHRQQQQQQESPCSTAVCGCQQSISHSCCSSNNSNGNEAKPWPLLPPLPQAAHDLDPDNLPDSSIKDKQLEKELLQASSQLYDQMAAQGAALQRQLGNLYTASLYSGIAALLSKLGEGLVGKRILCFSFGSGVVSSMFVLRGRQQVPLQQHCECWLQWQQQAWRQQQCSLQQMAQSLQLKQRLANRIQRGVSDFDAAMASLRAAYGAAPYQPSYGPLEELEENLVYLDRIDERFRRYYAHR